MVAGSVRDPCEHMFVLDARTLTPTEKGAIAETAIAARAVELGVVVARPVVEGRRYDLIFDTGERLLRVQCKWGALRDGVIRVQLAGSRLTPGRSYVRSRYSVNEVDAIAVYCPQLAQVYLLPIDDVVGLSLLHLRVDASKNNQRTFVRWAAQSELGAIAQLVERRTGSAKAEGSSPSSSTPPKAA